MTRDTPILARLAAELNAAAARTLAAIRRVLTPLSRFIEGYDQRAAGRAF